jgi:hypothetical protein
MLLELGLVMMPLAEPAYFQLLGVVIVVALDPAEAVRAFLLTFSTH